MQLLTFRFPHQNRPAATFFASETSDRMGSRYDIDRTRRLHQSGGWFDNRRGDEDPPLPHRVPRWERDSHLRASGVLPGAGAGAVARFADHARSAPAVPALRSAADYD